jgi:hypothetical protein
MPQFIVVIAHSLYMAILCQNAAFYCNICLKLVKGYSYLFTMN